MPRISNSTIFRLQARYAPYLFVTPFMLAFFCFILFPTIKSLVLAFYITNGPKSSVFLGLDNFAFMLRDRDFYLALKNTAVFALASIAIQLPLSLGLALLLNAAFLRARGFFRFIFVSPYLLGQVFVALMFSIIFAPREGLFVKLMHVLFAMPIDRNWLREPELIMPSIVLVSLWMYVGFNMIYFLAALQSVDKELYEAAAVDGANAWHRFWHVTLPAIKPVAVFVVVLSTIGSFQLFELAYLMLNQTAGSEQAGLTIVMYLYLRGFVAGDLGYASVVGWSLALGVLLISLLQMSLAGTWKNRDR